MGHIGMTLATMLRVLRQLSHDHRTLALIFVVPSVLMSLLWWVYSDQEGMFDRLDAIGKGVLGVTLQCTGTPTTQPALSLSPSTIEIPPVEVEMDVLETQGKSVVRVQVPFGDEPSADAGARVTFEWLPGKRFLIERWAIIENRDLKVQTR